MIHAFEIDYRRLRVQVCEHSIASRIVGPFEYAAGMVVHIAETDRPGRATLSAGRDDLAVSQIPLLDLGDLFALAYALHAERALLHHAAASDINIRIMLLLQRRLRFVCVPIEAPRFVGAIGRAISRPDTADINLLVETLAAVDRGVNGTDGLAGRVLTLLACHRQENGAPAIEEPFDPQP